jgi:NTP pyrophosphatase (non-canonical NTP hydrolase)
MIGPDGTAGPPLQQAGEPVGPLEDRGRDPPNLFALLLDIADIQTRRFPHHHGPFERLTRLAEEVGELAQQVNHAEDTGVKTRKHGPFKPENLAAEVADVLLVATGIAIHYGLVDQVRATIEARHRRNLERGDLLSTPVIRSGQACPSTAPNASPHCA